MSISFLKKEEEDYGTLVTYFTQMRLYKNGRTELIKSWSSSKAYAPKKKKKKPVVKITQELDMGAEVEL